MIRRYYENEMRYLADSGQAFADAHPEQARYLNIDSVADRDPYVERLFEGFAFLAGRIHERLDDELPQFTEGLVNLLYPHFLKPVPSLAILQFDPIPGMVQDTVILEKGTEVVSDSVGPKDTRCRFVTTQKVDLNPISLSKLDINYGANNTSSVCMRFDVEKTARMARLNLSPLRLHFHADASLASIMHLYFTRHVTGMVLRSPAGDGITVPLRGQQWVKPAGFADDEGMFPYSDLSFKGLRLLQEYLSFRRKFWFVDLFGVDRIITEEHVEWFEVEVFFDDLYPEDKVFSDKEVRLHCSPIANIFEQDAEPVRVEGLASEYRVVPDYGQGRFVEAYDVLGVDSVEDITGTRRSYQNYFEFMTETPDGEGRHFQPRRMVAAEDSSQVFLTLGGEGLEEAEGRPVETLTVKIRSTNGSLPREELQEGMITELGSNAPRVTKPVNITQPTLNLRPPIDRRQDLYWSLISHWSLNYKSVATRDALIKLMDLYDWTDTGANRRRLEGVTKVTTEPKERLLKGAITRGIEVTVTIQEGNFADEGDVCLFGLVMSEFFCMYATINSFVHFAIEMAPSGKRYEWKPERGAQPVL